MIVALIDNGSLEPAAHRNLRAVATGLTRRTEVTVEAVSWRHSDRIPAADLDDAPAWTLASWVRANVGKGRRDFLFVPFFISPQGAIGSALRTNLEKLSAELGGITFAFTEGLAERHALSEIVASRIRATIAARQLTRPPVVVVDHGGPSPTSAQLRDETAAQTRALLGDEIGVLHAASMEGAHGPLFADVLAISALAGRDVVVAPLFLSPGRHAGPAGDLARIAQASAARCHFTELVGTHPVAVETLAVALRAALTSTSIRLSA